MRVQSSIFKCNFFFLSFFLFNITADKTGIEFCLRVIFFPSACEFIFLHYISMDRQTGRQSNTSAKLVQPDHCSNALFFSLLTGIATLESPKGSQCSKTWQMHHLMGQQRHMTTSPLSQAVSLVPCLGKSFKTSLSF